MEPITEDWLKSIGFKWHQFDRQPDKQWLLWLGAATGAGDAADLGIEVCKNHNDDFWFCWLRSDCAHRYSRFIHVRHIKTRFDLVRMIEGITGQEFSAENNMYGIMHTSEKAVRLRADADRLDQRMLRESRPWRDIEKDDSRGGALPEHMQDSITNGTSK
jgi:hypothetical protein